MKLQIHYDSANTTAYTVDNSTFPVLYALSASQRLLLRNLDIQSAFTTELYRYDRPLYIRQLAKFDTTLTHPHRPSGLLRHNLYGTKPACNIYHADPDKHLRDNDFQPADSNPCLYIKLGKSSTTLAAVQICDFFVLAPNTVLLKLSKENSGPEVSGEGSGRPPRIPSMFNYSSRFRPNPRHTTDSNSKNTVTGRATRDQHLRTSPLPKQPDFEPHHDSHKQID